MAIGCVARVFVRLGRCGIKTCQNIGVCVGVCVGDSHGNVVRRAQKHNSPRE